MGKTTRHATVDEKGRLLIPEAIRRNLNIKSGDIFFIEGVDESGILRFAKAENPFDLLADHAVREYQAGRTRDLREIAAEAGVDLDAE